MKILIIGGVAGGATAAARLRRLSEENEIITHPHFFKNKIQFRCSCF
jgi:NADPH-dependent 2,4-dienoyl-CoA reductase/sulfur reductase-like enzyme